MTSNSSLRRLAGELTSIVRTTRRKTDPSKIAVIGNMNNAPLRLVEGLRSIGRDAHLFVNRREILHRPESIYPELLQSGYPAWIHDVSDVADAGNLQLDAKKQAALIRRLNRQFGLSILNDWAPSLAEELSHPHCTVLTGSDVAYYASFDTFDGIMSCWDLASKRSASGRQYQRDLIDLIRRQRDGIASSAVVVHPARSLVPENDKLLDALGVTDDRRMELLSCCTTQLESSPSPRNEILKVFSPSRVNFAHCGEGTIFTSQDLKGTNVLLEGFARFCADGGKAELHLVLKGNEIEPARAMIASNGFDDRVVWHKEMTTQQLRELMRSFDVICDQFNASPLGLITLDAYALGRPVLANFAVNNLPGRFPEPLPGLPASTPEEVAQQLARMAGDVASRQELGAQSRRYAEKYLSCEVMAQKLLDRYSAGQ